METKTVKVAIVQVGSCPFDTPATIEKVRAYCAQAAGTGAKLAVFPEALVGGYPKGSDFDVKVGSRTPEGRDEFRRYYESAVDLPGRHFESLSKIARQHGLLLAIGVIERDGGTLYCTFLFIGTNGELCGKHRKVMPTAMERLIWGFGDASTMPVVQTDFGTLGAAICWENYMPLFRVAMYAKNVGIWCAPTVDDRDVWQSTMQHIALEGRCFVLSACQYLVHPGSPGDDGSHPNRCDIKGGSLIVSPSGQILAGPLRGQEGILTAELDLNEIARGKFDFDVTGHYARPDLFSLHVDERPKRPVSFSE